MKEERYKVEMSKIQKVEMYYDMVNAYREIAQNISRDWFVHTCTAVKHGNTEKVIVVYEKNN